MSKAYIQRDEGQRRHEVHIKLLACNPGGPAHLAIRTNAEEGDLRVGSPNMKPWECVLVRGEVLTIVIED